MGKGLRYTKEVQENRTEEERIALIKYAIEDGQHTRKAIKEATGLSRMVINKLLRDNAELRGLYKNSVRMIVNTAADNIQDIIEDPEHPQNFQASKYVLSTYKSDLDSFLEAKDSDELTAEINVEGANSPVSIVFGKKKE